MIYPFKCYNQWYPDSSKHEEKNKINEKIIDQRKKSSKEISLNIWHAIPKPQGGLVTTVIAIKKQ